MWLPKSVIEETDEKVRVVYVDMALAALWNEKRDAGEPRLFTGYYWLNGSREGGPFKSRSSAVRDAWYRVVNQSIPPSINGQLPRRRQV
jgi:hypothetical protein